MSSIGIALKESRLARSLLLGLLLREAFSFWTGHPYDFEVWMRTGHAIASGANPYSMPWGSLPGVSIGYTDQTLPSAAYLPFWPFLVGGIYRFWEAVGFGNRFFLYFLVKQPGIVADVITAYLLYVLVNRWTSDTARALTAATYWSLFPYTILITAIWGQFDSIVVCLVLIALVARGPLQRNLLWGVGILVKWVTAVFLPLELFRERGPRRGWFVLAVLVPISATLAIFVAEGWSLVQITAGGVSQTHGGGYGMNLALLLSIPPGSAWIVSVPALYEALGWIYVPGVVVAGWVGSRWLRVPTPPMELRALLLVVGVFLLLRWGLYEQYLLYLFSLLLLDVIAFHPARRTFLTTLAVLTLVDLFVNNDLGLRFLSPLNPGIWTYVSMADNHGAYGVARTLALVALAIAVTATLVQFVAAIVRDDPEPVPWIVGWVGPLRRRLRSSGSM